MAKNKMMQGLGKDIQDPEQRKRFLKDNADSVVEKTYMKPFNDFKKQLKPLKERRNKMIENIRAKAELVTEVCYCFVNTEERMTCFYNEIGDCIEARPCTADELQKTMFQTMRLAKTGTDDK